MEPQTIHLKDGRQLAYMEYGSPDGEPLIFLHGTPGTHHQVQFLIDAAQRLNLRLIVPDRPGYSLSDPKPGYTLLDYTDDISELADTLSLPRFGLLGVSGGGPYTLAAAFKIPERLTFVGIVSSPAPPSDEDTAAVEPRADLMTEHQEFADRAQNDTDAVINEIISSLPDEERALQEQNREWVTLTLQEAYRQGPAGRVDDYLAAAKGWGFAPEAITLRVYLWHGEQDLNVPVESAHLLVKTIPDTVVTYFPNAGHFMPDADFDSIMVTAASILTM